MPFTPDNFARLRPYAYHLTAAANIRWIARDTRLHPASYWIHKASRPDLLRTKRKEIIELTLGSRRISLRDQFPLYEGKMSLERGITFEDFVELLNGRVFFWPGDAMRPNGYGQRHFARYRDEPPLVIRVETTELFAANSNLAPEFCCYNSGSPRPSNGIKPLRGRSTFVQGNAAGYSAGKAIELAFCDGVRLPASTLVSRLGKWEWKPLSAFAS